ncbi:MULTISPECIES: sensor histidine kinase [Streptosporangium]|uniref:histidine kinase n=1 Tax=Streptosporangium brasiliense TaxID=47480 RepID=A0ABT9RL43_9ACTN|nr:HAMP domain-containing sensor histidine kinase [Streptosporangium brasiliense]MDP9869000.1 signal transduction histidine kinase [Streptosporangium brasiliense]
MIRTRTGGWQALRRLRPATERARLTVLYGSLLLGAACVLVTVIYSLVQDGLDNRIGSAFSDVRPGIRVVPLATSEPQPGSLIPSDQAGEYAQTKMVGAAADATLSRLLTVSGIALAVFAAFSLLLAWWMAGRVLRPVGVITATARKLSGENLHQRIGLKSPPGELKELADTFDQMLDRIEQLVTAQRRFAANAAHELRTPLAVQRAAADIGLLDTDPERVRWIRSKLIEVADHSEHLIESLLLLAATDQGLERPEPVALDKTATNVAAELADEAGERGISVEITAAPTTVEGDPVLLAHLVRNLLGNALRYNEWGGIVRITLTAPDRTLTVANTGSLVPADEVPLLFEPFRRLHERRHTAGEGAGLGLSIVASIARAHGAAVTAEANPRGGLTVRVCFP